MDEPRLEIPVKKYTEESAVISMRLPRDMLAEIDKIAVGTGRTRNEVMLLCTEFALKHLDIQNP